MSHDKRRETRLRRWYNVRLVFLSRRDTTDMPKEISAERVADTGGLERTRGLQGGRRDAPPRRVGLAGLWLLASSLGPVVASPAPATQVTFRLHVINPESTYSACAAVDVNRDGRLDVICGGWWYEAPKWERRFLRDVEIIRGRYDDYSNLPLDVNGDGWTDLVSANYRSGKLYWIEHPGASLGPWTAHLIAAPGPMETARLFDVDADGQLDVLPNGARFAAWWEVVRERNAPEVPPRWVRHDLPGQLAGHGLGFGDINGDGRGDVVAPGGWLEAPPDRREGRWRWHGEFELSRDASVPILAFDVDGDGDGDVVWGRGHRFGLYWMEHRAGESIGARWVRHAIDTGWSQFHSLLLADLTGDGRREVIAGKRYMGHDGRDPGEHDPLVICWYRFDRRSRTWQRGFASRGGGAGFGLDPKAVDLDLDGDIDLLGPGRSGLVWLENLRISSGRSPATRSGEPPRLAAYEDRSRLLSYRDALGAVRAVSTAREWALRRAHILAGMQLVMGELPEPALRVPLAPRIVDEMETTHYSRRKLTFAAEPGDRVPAYLILPKNLPGKAPAVLCLHQTTRIGKDEPVGLGGRPSLRYADELGRRGYVCLAPDYPSFGEYVYDFKKDGRRYASGTMKAIWNNIRALDLLESLPQVDADRIGCIGHSLGGHNAMFTAAFDRRIRATISSCGFTAFHDYYGGKLAGWTSDRYMPRIRDVYRNDPDKVPFDFYGVVGALAPRPFFVNAPLGDSNFDVGGVRKVLASAAEVYGLLRANGRVKAVHPDCGHDFPTAVRQQAYAWLDEQLK